MSKSKKTNRGPLKNRSSRQSESDDIFIWGIHAVAGALANPLRRVDQLCLTRNASQRISEMLDKPMPKFSECSPKEIDALLKTEAVHQGALLKTAPLQTLDISDIEPLGAIGVLDQVTDPHNVGAVLRSAAAFGIQALVMTHRNSPPLSGALAKTASGGLERVPIALVANLAQALRLLQSKGFTIIGFDGEAAEQLETSFLRQPRASNQDGVALVFGAEEKGLRRLTLEHCDHVCRIAVSDKFASLNVSNAAAIAFHHFRQV